MQAWPVLPSMMHHHGLPRSLDLSLTFFAHPPSLGFLPVASYMQVVFFWSTRFVFLITPHWLESLGFIRRGYDDWNSETAQRVSDESVSHNLRRSIQIQIMSVASRDTWNSWTCRHAAKHKRGYTIAAVVSQSKRKLGFRDLPVFILLLAPFWSLTPTM